MILTMIKVCANGAWNGKYKEDGRSIWKFISKVEKQSLQFLGIVAGKISCFGEWVSEMISGMWTLIKSDSKICSKCNDEKLKLDFYESRAFSDGRHHECKECCCTHKQKPPNKTHYRKYFSGLVNDSYSYS